MRDCARNKLVFGYKDRLYVFISSVSQVVEQKIVFPQKPAKKPAKKPGALSKTCTKTCTSGENLRKNLRENMQLFRKSTRKHAGSAIFLTTVSSFCRFMMVFLLKTWRV